MIKTIFAVLSFAILLSFNVKAQDHKPFLGDWEVTLIEQGGDEFPWSAEVKYPVRFSIREEGGKLVGTYTDQYDFSDKFSVLAIAENEIIFVVGGIGKKYIDALGPVHRAILKNGVLHGFVFTDQKLFGWTAKRKENESSDLSGGSDLCFDPKAEKPEIKRATTERVINGKLIRFSDCCPIMIKALEQPPPVYPMGAALVGVEGNVTVRIVVDENGKVVWARVEDGHPLLRKASLQAVCKTVFEPYVCFCGEEEKLGFETLVTYVFKRE